MPHARPAHPPGPSEPSAGSRVAPSTAARVVAVLVAVQALGLVVAGGYLIVRALFPDATHRGSTEVLGFLSLLVGVGVGFGARAVAARRRQPALVVLELLCLPVAVTIIQGGRWYIGIPLGLVAVAALVLLFLAGLLLPDRDDPS